MKFLFYPFALLYGLAIVIRNLLFDMGVLKSKSTSIKSIGVGNLRVGGTGKTPMVSYLLNRYKQHKTAMLSRGYGRFTTGFRIVETNLTAGVSGDEAMMIKIAHPESVVAVDENRIRGAQELAGTYDLDLLVLDDVMQHRYIAPNVLIALTAFSDPYFQDYLLPVGRLREPRFGIRRADILVVTKCPAALNHERRTAFLHRIKRIKEDRVFFAKEVYECFQDQHGSPHPIDMIRGKSIVLVTGLADASRLHQFVAETADQVMHFEYGDHHAYSRHEYSEWARYQFEDRTKPTCVITTPKDYVKIKSLLQEDESENIEVFVIQHKMAFLEQDEARFNSKLDELLGEG